MFGRKKKAAAAADEASTAPDPTTDAVDSAAPADEAGADAATGPRDSNDVTDVSALLDLGALLLAPTPGTEVRLEVDQQSDDVTAVQVADDHGAVQLQVFAAPRSAGIWDEIREEIAEMISGSGGTVEFRRSGRSATVDAATSLMDAGEDAGVRMPFGCRMGICQSCVVGLLEGHVRDLRTGVEHEPGTRVQTCVSAASGDCVLDV